ncbi:unnamed protein product [Rotaria sordida]|uniref:CWF21 domain-containing protein n=1 Tax=Rotaria sordida TaxID=392033 RepID=A0A814I150_9BILA|nr:unnamed protein product [Rotaria sordida]CAF1035046.1 unnamed protein product [Rotaria sordida]CAF1139277.1 unnamed protein product [Rotaria sordida]CAF1150977.1 unnamed protein product [Rotaria sordida]CAF3546214.1 unnamed protein product [Rotaria sordida]
MYNGIGITTPRGTGTNGYVQKNLSFVPTKRERVEYVKDAEIKKLETLIEKKGNAEILEHEKKRRIEVKCMEMRDMMLNNGYDEEVTNQKVQKFRKMLIEREGLYDKTEVEYDEYGRPVAKETHQLAQANDEKNRRLREAFGIGEFDKKKINEKKAEEVKEAERRKIEVANKQYTIVPEVEEVDEVEEREQPTKDKEKKKDKEDRHRHKSHDEKKRKSSPEITKERSSHKHSKKHRNEHSDDEESRHHRRRERSP